jgi:uncharacterized protein YkvS
LVIQINGKTYNHEGMVSLREEIIVGLKKAGNIIHLRTDGDYHFRNEECSKNEVITKLKYHIGEQQYSDLFLDQLAIINEGGYVSIKYPHLNKVERAYYMPDDIYLRLHDLIDGRAVCEEKPFKKNGSYLKGKNLFHIHHNSMSYIDHNVCRYFSKKYPADEDIIRDLELLDKQYDKPINKLIEYLVIRRFREISEFQVKVSGKPFRITGEWLIYQKKNDRFNFIGLFLHNDRTDHDDKNLYDLVKPYLIPGYFPNE